MKKADCPGCGRTVESKTDVFWCVTCQCQFDNDPDEGGDYSSRDPSARLEREERRQERRQHGMHTRHHRR